MFKAITQNGDYAGTTAIRARTAAAEKIVKFVKMKENNQVVQNLAEQAFQEMSLTASFTTSPDLRKKLIQGLACIALCGSPDWLVRVFYIKRWMWSPFMSSMARSVACPA